MAQAPGFAAVLVAAFTAASAVADEGMGTYEDRERVQRRHMRAYENGQPAKPASFLPFSTAGVADGELVFVSGNPGSTSRLHTTAQLEAERDVTLPLILELLKRRRRSCSPGRSTRFVSTNDIIGGHSGSPADALVRELTGR